MIGVNGFVFISGFYGIKFNLKRVISIVIQAISYSVVFYLAFCQINRTDIDIVSFFKSFFPIARKTWWFITIYIGLYFIAPFLNAGIKNISKKELLYILTGLFILNCFSSFFFGGISDNGYDIFNFIFLYLTGRFIKQNNIAIKRPGMILLMCIGIVGVLGITFTYVNKHAIAWQLFYYNNPILIVSAISLFFIFLHLKIGHRTYINNIAQLILGVYMIHDYQEIRDYIAGIVDLLKNNFNVALLPLLLIILIISIFSICSLIEYVRLFLYNSLFNKINDSLRIREYNARLITYAKTRWHRS